VLFLEIVVFSLAVLVAVMFRIQTRSMREHPPNNPVPGIGIGSAPQITDAGSIGWPSLLDALAQFQSIPTERSRWRR
jgi:hypothetical protein